MNRTVINILLILFAILTLISSLLLYYSHQIPIEKKSVVTLYAYEHDGTFNYIASLKPNTMYNKTTLEPGEGPIFTRITNDIKVNFTYDFQGSEPTNLTVQYYVSEYLETSIWQKQISEVRLETINLAGTSINLSISNIPPITISSLQNTINMVNQETGVIISQYNVTTEVQMSIEAETNEGIINELFVPKLTMRFTSSYTEGDIISIEDVQHSKTGEITTIDTIYQPWVNTQRYISYALSIISLPGLLAIIWAYAKSKPAKPTRPEALIEEVMGPFREVIIEIAQEPQFKERLTTVSMKTLEDLVKVADILVKPIVHIRKLPETHIFYVIDETTRYEYTMTESSLIERMKKEEE